jgi:hypothetical protein
MKPDGPWVKKKLPRATEKARGSTNAHSGKAPVLSCTTLGPLEKSFLRRKVSSDPGWPARVSRVKRSTEELDCGRSGASTQQSGIPTRDTVLDLGPLSKVGASKNSNDRDRFG